MSRPFANYPANPAFANLNQKMFSSEYIIKKKNKLFCNQPTCSTTTNYNKTQLYSNLYTKLQLNSDVISITDLSGNTVVPVNNNAPYKSYITDPNGSLFGKTPCGISNFLFYVTKNNI